MFHTCSNVLVFLKMSEKCIITVKQGKLLGKIGYDYLNRPFHNFKGIPYAKPPVGKLRFKAPQEPEAWTGIRDATKEGFRSCSFYPNSKRHIASEDCLFLNVYTPSLPSTKTAFYPVMFWIHGGGFVEGSGDEEVFGPEFLVQHDVVLVTINYRLGLFGFLNFDDTSLDIPGNAGLKDQVMALKWVKNNIHYFNGDDNNVTIFGESAGGSSVHYLVLSPMAKGLFHKAIIQSGTAFNCWARGQPSAPLLNQVLEHGQLTERQIYEILMNKSVEEIIEIQKLLGRTFIVSEKRPIGPVVEKNVLKVENCFLPKDPIEIISSGNYSKVPMMVGYCSREGMLSEMDLIKKHGQMVYSEDFEASIPYAFNFLKGSDVSKACAKKIKQFYFRDENVCEDNIDDFFKLETDNMFLKGIYALLRTHLVSTVEPIYFYRVSLDTKLNYMKRVCQLNRWGVCHEDELGYLFKNYFTPTIRTNSKEHEGINIFTILWTNFAYSGNPNTANFKNLDIIEWKPVQTELFYFLDIGENVTLGINPDNSRMKFWDDILNIVPHKYDTVLSIGSFHWNCILQK